MDEKELDIDKAIHIVYSKQIKVVILSFLRTKYQEEKVKEIWEKAQLKYVEFLKDAPYYGGKKCRHNGPAGTYDCIAMFALYEVMEEKPTIQEMYDMLNKVLLPPFHRLGKIANMNKKGLRPLINKAFTFTSKVDDKLLKTCPTGYIMKVEKYDKEKGIRYRFNRCPIAEFAKEHGYLDIMPAFCNGDYPALKEIHAGLIREYTCANHNYCDYWIVGDESEYLKKYPISVDEKGFMRSIGVKEEN